MLLHATIPLVLRLALPVVIATVVAAPARADTATVVLVSPAEAPPELAEAVTRLRGELLSLGLKVVVDIRPAARRGGTPDPRAWLQRHPTETEPLAVIEAVAATPSPAMDIWVSDRRRGTIEVSRVTLEPQVDNAPGRMAIRAVEVLRSNLLAMDLAAREPATATATASASTAPAAPTPPAAAGNTAVPATAASGAPASPVETAPPTAHLAVAAGAALMSSLDGVGPALLPLGRVEWSVRPWLALQATVAGLGSRPNITGAATAGSARVAQQVATLGACLCAPPSAAAILGLHLALSAGVLRTAIDAQADAPAQVHPIRRWSLLFDASVGARVHLSGRYLLTLAAHVQVAEPYVAIHFIDTRVASTGRPNVLLSLTVGAWL